MYTALSLRGDSLRYGCRPEQSGRENMNYRRLLVGVTLRGATVGRAIRQAHSPRQPTCETTASPQCQPPNQTLLCYLKVSEKPATQTGTTGGSLPKPLPHSRSAQLTKFPNPNLSTAPNQKLFFGNTEYARRVLEKGSTPSRGQRPEKKDSKSPAYPAGGCPGGAGIELADCSTDWVTGSIGLCSTAIC